MDTAPIDFDDQYINGEERRGVVIDIPEQDAERGRIKQPICRRIATRQAGCCFLVLGCRVQRGASGVDACKVLFAHFAISIY